MFEYFLVFGVGLFIGMSYSDIDIEKKENLEYKKQRLIIQRIQEDYNNGYKPDFDLYKKLYIETKK
jgi:hypothetical protein